MSTKNQDHPFFRPLWRRVAIVVLTGVWSAVEWYNGETTWGMLTLAVCLYAVWTFFITYPPAVAGSETPAGSPAAPGSTEIEETRK